MANTNDIVLSEKEEQQLRALRVEGILLFGSRAQGVAGKASDYDIGVLTGKDARDIKDLYDAVYGMFSEKIHVLVDIDIVFLRGAPLELQFHAAKHGVTLYQQSYNTISRFREDVMRQYADFAPLRRQFHQGTLNRIV